MHSYDPVRSILILDKMPGLTLKERFKGKEASLKNLQSLLMAYLDALKKVTELHSLGVYQNDLGSNNILINDDSSISIIDFGRSAYLDSEDELVAPLSQRLPGKRPGPQRDFKKLNGEFKHLFSQLTVYGDQKNADLKAKILSHLFGSKKMLTTNEKLLEAERLLKQMKNAS